MRGKAGKQKGLCGEEEVSGSLPGKGSFLDECFRAFGDTQETLVHIPQSNKFRVFISLILGKQY